MDLTSFLMGRITGGGGVPSSTGDKPVKFIDYDGTIVYSYTPEEFLALDAMPENPQHEGLISEGWNYTFEEAKSQVETVGDLVAGQTYITDDGATRFHVQIDKNNYEIAFQLTQRKLNGAIIDWGDGSPTETYSTESIRTTHIYEKAGEYCISVLPDDDCQISYSGVTSSPNANDYRANLVKVYFGKNINLWMNTFQYCYRLVAFTLTKTVTISNYSCFCDYCYSLTGFVMPNLGGSINLQNQGTFEYCFSLTRISIPLNFIGIGSGFNGCYSLLDISLPKTITIFNSQLSYAVSLKRIVFPPSITTMPSGMFMSCSTLEDVSGYSGVTSIKNSTFNSCYSLKKFNMLNNITSIEEYAFNNCRSLKEITLSNSLTQIGSSAFSNCYSLQNIIIPKSVTSIGSYVFSQCNSLFMVDCSNLTNVPTLTGGGAFNGCPPILKIIVPDALYNDWIAATNWSTYADRIVKASEVQ